MRAEQASIVEDVQEQLAEARANLEDRANLLPEAVEQAKDTLESLEENFGEAAAESANEAAESLSELALPSEERGEQPGEGEQSG